MSSKQEHRNATGETLLPKRARHPFPPRARSSHEALLPMRDGTCAPKTMDVETPHVAGKQPSARRAPPSDRANGTARPGRTSGAPQEVGKEYAHGHRAMLWPRWAHRDTMGRRRRDRWSRLAWQQA